ncbi:Endonuclease/exonuclease/phosphatase, partial [Pilaira anomala]
MIPVSNSSSTINTTKSTSFTIGSLNCRSLVKSSSTSVISPFIRHLKTPPSPSPKLDILTLQETHASTPEIITSLNLQFQSKSQIWTKHCGIISLNSSLRIEHIFTSADERLIHCRISHIDLAFPSFNLITIYAPASSTLRHQFYAELLSLPIFAPFLPDADPELSPTHPPLIITGDFNFNSSRISLPTSNDQSSYPFTNNSQRNWHSLLCTHFYECTHPSLDHPLTTFRRGTSSSTLDNIFTSPSLYSSLSSSTVEFLNSQWTDHALLTSTFQFGSERHGRGLWKGNPHLASNPYFIKAFHDCIDNRNYCTEPYTLPYLGGASSPQQLWDDLKIEIKRLMRSFSRHVSTWRHKQLDKLQRKRDRIMLPSSIPLGLTTHPKLTTVEHQIGILQNEIAQNENLKSSRHW